MKAILIPHADDITHKFAMLSEAQCEGKRIINIGNVTGGYTGSFFVDM